MSEPSVTAVLPGQPSVSYCPRECTDRGFGVTVSFVIVPAAIIRIQAQALSRV